MRSLKIPIKREQNRSERERRCHAEQYSDESSYESSRRGITKTEVSVSFFELMQELTTFLVKAPEKEHTKIEVSVSYFSTQALTVSQWEFRNK